MHHFEFKANDYLIPQYYSSLKEVFKAAYKFYRYSTINDASTLRINLVNYGTIYAVGEDFLPNQVRVWLDNRCIRSYSNRFMLTGWIANGTFQDFIDPNHVYLNQIRIVYNEDTRIYVTNIEYLTGTNQTSAFNWICNMPILTCTELDLISKKTLKKICWEKEGF